MAVRPVLPPLLLPALLVAAAAALAAAPAAASTASETRRVWVDASLGKAVTDVMRGFESAYPGSGLTVEAVPDGWDTARLQRELSETDDPERAGIITAAPVHGTPPCSPGAARCREVLTVAWATEALVVVYNAPGVAGGDLVLDVETVAQLLGGGVARWNDSRLAALNPSLASDEGLEVRRVYASDALDVDTAAFVLGAANETAPGLAWPWDDGAPDALAEDTALEAVFRVLGTPGAVAVVPGGAAERAGTSDVARMRNAYGSVVSAGRDTVMQASLDYEPPEPNSVDAVRLASPTGRNAWPLSAFVHVSVTRESAGDGPTGESCHGAGAVLRFARWWLDTPEAVELSGAAGLNAPPARASDVAHHAFAAFECDGLGVHLGFQEVFGSGASLPAAAQAAFTFRYSAVRRNTRLHYLSKGSAAGKAELLNGTVAYGGSDSLFTEAELAAHPGVDVDTVPFLVGGLVVVYNLGDAAAADAPPLVLSRGVTEGLFSGRIASLSAPEVAALNEGLAGALPAGNLTVVYHSGARGTTHIFTEALNSFSGGEYAVSNEFSLPEAEAGRGLAASGNRGVAAAVLATPASVGYVGFDFAVANGLSYATLVNRAGREVRPSPAALLGAVDDFEASLGGTAADHLTGSLVDGAGDGTWPLAGFTYVMFRASGPSRCDERAAALDYLEWALTDPGAASEAADLGFGVLPEGFQRAAVARLHAATCLGTPLTGGCPAGQGIEGDPPQCVACAVGHFSSASSRECAPCPAGTASGDDERAVAECVPCAAHQHQALEGQTRCLLDDVLEAPPELRVAGHAVAAVGVALTAAAGGLVHIRRKHQLIVAATPIFMQVELVGCVCAYAAVSVFSLGKSTRGVCALTPWLASMAFVLVMVPLALKTWRLNRIFHSSKLRVQRIPTSRMLAAVLVAAAVESALHGARQLAGGTSAVRQAAPAAVHTDVYVCDSPAPAALWWVLLLAPKVAVSLYTAVLSYKVRDLADEFNESQSLAVVSSVILVSMAVGLPLVVTSEANPTAEFILVMGSLFAVATAVIGMLHVSKFWSLFVTHDHSIATGTSGAAGHSLGTSGGVFKSGRVVVPAGSKRGRRALSDHGPSAPGVASLPARVGADMSRPPRLAQRRPSAWEITPRVRAAATTAPRPASDVEASPKAAAAARKLTLEEPAPAPGAVAVPLVELSASPPPLLAPMPPRGPRHDAGSPASPASPLAGRPLMESPALSPGGARSSQSGSRPLRPLPSRRRSSDA